MSAHGALLASHAYRRTAHGSVQGPGRPRQARSRVISRLQCIVDPPALALHGDWAQRPHVCGRGGVMEWSLYGPDIHGALSGALQVAGLLCFGRQVSEYLGLHVAQQQRRVRNIDCTPKGIRRGR